MANELYPKLKLVINGNVITQFKSKTADWDPKLTPVETDEGRSGYSEGARFSSLSGELAVPKAGPQFNPVQAMTNREKVFIQVFAGPLSGETEGVVTGASLAGSTDNETLFSFSFEGEWIDLK